MRLRSLSEAGSTTIAVTDLDQIRNTNSDHFVVSLDGPLSTERREQLQALLTSEFTYLPENMLLISAADLERLRSARLNFVRGATPYLAEWKLDPGVGNRLTPFTQSARQALEAAGRLRLIVTLFADADPGTSVDSLLAAGAQVSREFSIGEQMLLDVEIPEDELGELLAHPSVQYVEEAPEVTLRNSQTRWIVQTNLVGVTPLYTAGLHGEGQIVGILDSQIDVNHCSFRDDVNPIGPDHRKIIAYNTTLGSGSHGTLVAGIVAGDNGDNSDTRGIAYLAKLAFNTTPFGDEMAAVARLQTHHDQGARIHTNSWGDDGTGAYNALCRAMDQFAYDNEDDLVLFAVTNLPVLRNPENAKNILAVGACGNFPNQENHCSGGAGPTMDARRKPEIYAPGCAIASARWNTVCSVMPDTGTSMAAPAVAGVAALIRQYFVDGFYPSGAANPADSLLPTAALLKAMLLDCSADMTGIPGYPSNKEGWGRLTADNVLFLAGDTRRLVVRDVRNTEGLSTDQIRSYSIAVDSSGEPLRVTLAWTEPAAAAGVFAAHVNDLNLEVTSPAGVEYLGNVFAAGASVPGGAHDARNNVEQAHFNNPTPGKWFIRVKGTAINQGTQGFALVITGAVSDDTPPLIIRLPNGVPAVAPVDETSTFTVQITPVGETLATDGGLLRYRMDGGEFQSSALVFLADDLYEATLPSGLCADAIQFYLSAQAEGGTIRTFPDGAPDSFFTVRRGDLTTVFDDDFETDQGWTIENSPTLVTGGWERGVPAGDGGRGDSPADHDGSGACYVTQNGVGDFDIDGGETWLTSPLLDLSGGDAEIRFAAWMSNHFGMAINEDVFIARLSNDNGANWTLAYVLGPDSSGVWNPVVLRVSDFVAPTAEVRIRFEASDLIQPSVVEAAVDAVSVVSVLCQNPPSSLPGDMNCDFVITVSDIGGFVLAITDPPGYAAAYPDCDMMNADMNDDDAVTVADIGPFVQVLTGP